MRASLERCFFTIEQEQPNPISKSPFTLPIASIGSGPAVGLLAEGGAVSKFACGYADGLSCGHFAFLGCDGTGVARGRPADIGEILPHPAILKTK